MNDFSNGVVVYQDPWCEIRTSDGSDPFTTGLTSIKVNRQPQLSVWSKPIEDTKLDAPPYSI